ncbi:Protein of unknown function [Gryllus bimaculatus]|nr:Protein of unknown function [Gryllus bimaculatus]
MSEGLRIELMAGSLSDDETAETVPLPLRPTLASSPTFVE